MKLATRITAAVSIAFAVVLTTSAGFLVMDELDFVDEEIDRHSRLLGRVVAGVAQQTVAADGEDAARRLLQEIDQHESRITIRWLRLDDEAATSGALDASVMAALRRGDILGRISPQDDDTLYTYVPLSTDQPATHAVQIAESLDARNAHIRDVLLRVFGAAAVGLLLSGGLAWLMGRRLVSGPVRELVATARAVGEGDFTRQANEQPSHELGELARAMNEMTKALGRARGLAAEQERARQRIEAELRHADRLATLGQLASGVAHEIGTPLQAISIRAGMVGEEAGDIGRVNEHVDAISRHTHRVAKLVRNLLRFARRQPTRHQAHDLRHVVEDALALVSTVNKTTVEIVPRLPDEPAMAEVDDEQIGQVLTNLVINGMQAMPEGGRLTVALDPVRAHSPGKPLEETGEYLRIRVEDEGVGIPEDVARHVFDPFFTTKEVGKGTGLGLSVSYGIVHEHQGWIELDSTPGEGTRFDVYLPADRCR